MTAKIITGIIILALNLTGIFFMVLIFLMFLKNRFQKKRSITSKGMPGNGKKKVKQKVAFKKADYLLDDMDLSQFDDIDLDEK